MPEYRYGLEYDVWEENERVFPNAREVCNEVITTGRFFERVFLFQLRGWSIDSNKLDFGYEFEDKTDRLIFCFHYTKGVADYGGPDDDPECPPQEEFRPKLIELHKRIDKKELSPVQMYQELLRFIESD